MSPPSSTAAAKPPSVLIVEDDRDVREALVDVLEEEGIIVASAVNGSEALAYLRNAAVLPKLILLDLMMPVMDGREFRSEQVKVLEFAAVPVVVMTAAGNFDHDAMRSTVAGALKKPLHLVELLSLVQRFH